MLADDYVFPTGYNITLTTAQKGEGIEYPFRGEGDRASIFRATGNGESFINIADGLGTTSLTLSNLILDGKDAVLKGDGGAVKTKNCVVNIDHVDFLNFKANNGGAVFIEFDDRTSYTKELTVENALFRNCVSESQTNRQGGGAIWTNAKTFTMADSQFNNCSAHDQGGAVFHRIDRYTYQTASKSTLTNCTFTDCEARAGGGLELDALDVTLTNCAFERCTASQRNGGGANIYIYDSGNSTLPSSATVTGCTFTGCKSVKDGNSSSFGGGLRSSVLETHVWNCTFTDNISSGSGSGGGGLAISNTNATVAEVLGCTFSGNQANGSSGGGLYCTALETTVGDYVLEDGTVVRTTFTGNSTNNSGAGIYYNRADGGIILDNCLIRNNTARTQGGGVYTAGNITLRNSTLISGNHLTGTTADNAAGVYIPNGKTLTLGASGQSVENSCVRGNTLNNGTASNLRLPEADGVNSNSVIVKCDLGGDIRVVNAKIKNTQFGEVEAPDYLVSYGAGNTPVFRSDDGTLYGMRDEDNKVIWNGDPICKITDADGHILYKDAACTVPAVYEKLDHGSGKTESNWDNAYAFDVLKPASPELYTNEGGENKRYEGDTYCVKMLVESHTLPGYITTEGGANRTIIFTTAGTDESDGYSYPRNAASPYAKITRGNFTQRMITARSNLTLENITLDGGSRQGKASNESGGIVAAIENPNNLPGGKTLTVTLNENATLQNSYSKATSNNIGAGGVHLNYGHSMIMNEGSVIRNCSADRNGGGVYKDGGAGKLEIRGGSIINCTAQNGGGVYHTKGTFEMSGGTISNCSATDGGGVYVVNGFQMTMKGGSITGNKATAHGGGIAVGGTNTNTRLNFSGGVVVRRNTLTSDRSAECNVELNYNSNAIINTSGLTSEADIGVYVPGEKTAALYMNRGIDGARFGTKTSNDCLYRFINDRDRRLRGSNRTDNGVYWKAMPALEVVKTVASDSEDDKNLDFEFTVQFTPWSESAKWFGDMYIDATGKATFKLKDGQYKAAIDETNAFTDKRYVVTETTVDGFEAKSAKMDKQGNYIDAGADSASGTIGENLDESMVSSIMFTNTRKPGTLVVEKRVEGSNPQGKDTEFIFVVTLSDSSIGAEEDKTFGDMTFTNGVATFRLKHGQSLSAEGLPYGIGITVQETGMWDRDTEREVELGKYLTQVACEATDENNAPAEMKTAFTVNEEEHSAAFEHLEDSGITATFTNTWYDPIARVRGSGEEEWRYFEALVDITEGGEVIVPGAFDYAETLDGDVIIETLLETHERYKLPAEVTLARARTVTLRTTQDEVWNPEANRFTSAIIRDFDGGSMLAVTGGSLTVENITLDGGAAAGRRTTANGGIIRETAGTLTIRDGATLRNAVTTGCGGAVYVGFGATGDFATRARFVMTGGVVTANQAEKGGGVYIAGDSTDARWADSGSTVSITGGEFSENTATNNGGGLFIGAGRTGSINGAAIQKNKALGTTAVEMGGGGRTNDHNGSGGGIYLDRASSLAVSNSSIAENDAYRGGGGIYLHSSNYRYAAATLSNVQITDNVASCGGGIGAINMSHLVLRDGTALSGNLAVVRSTAPLPASDNVLYHNGCGGAIGLQSFNSDDETAEDGKSVLDVSGVRIENNTAESNGGGFYIDGGSRYCVLSGATVSGNTATNGGGGYAGTVTLRNTQITGNTTTAVDGTIDDIRGGGGLYITGSLTLRDDAAGTPTNIDGNYTAGNGGHSVEKSDLRLPFNDTTKDNAANSVILKAAFTGKIRVCDPGTVYSRFGSADELSYLFDSDDPETWDTVPNITSEDGSRLFGRISRNDDGNSCYLYWWQEPICKITDIAEDGSETLLYLDEACTKPAVYLSLYDSSATANSAFGALNDTGVKLYKKGVGEYTGSKFCVKLLADCPINESVKVHETANARKTITLTTAETRGECTDGLPFRGTGSTAKLYPGPLYHNGSYDFLFVLNNDTDMTVRNITVDGGVNYNLDSDGRLRMDAGGKPSYQSDSFISGKDGVLFQIGGSSRLTLDDGATLQNAYTTHQYGGGAISFGNNTSGGGSRQLVLKQGSLITRCCAEAGSDGSGGVGGAIMVYNAGRNSVVIEGGRIEDCWAQRSGGAIYMPNASHTLEIRGGAIKNCTAAQGGGIYLAGDAKLSMQGALDYAGNYSTDATAYAGYAALTNGGSSAEYSGNRVPSDIFVSAMTGDPATAITLTEDIQAEEGSIWVWIDNTGADPTHHKDKDQFAVLADGLGESEDELPEGGTCDFTDHTVNVNTYKVFRNARDDGATNNDDPEHYLTGQPGDTAVDSVTPKTKSGMTCVYWGPAVDGFNLVFRKIDGFGNALSGAAFTLYASAKSGDTEIPTDTVYRAPTDDEGTSKDVQAADAVPVMEKVTDASGNDKAEERDAYGSGLVVFEKVPKGTYFLKETTYPAAGSEAGAPTYTGVNGVETMYKIVMDSKGWYTMYAPGVDGRGNPSWTGTLSEAPSTQFVKGADGKYTAPAGAVQTGDVTLNVYTVRNVSPITRKVMLRKVDAASGLPLQGAVFELLNCDLSGYDFGVDDTGSDATARYMQASDSEGVFFIGRLPLGTYYLKETTAPAGYTLPAEGLYYRLKVPETGDVELSAAAEAPAAPEDPTPTAGPGGA